MLSCVMFVAMLRCTSSKLSSCSNGTDNVVVDMILITENPFLLILHNILFPSKEPRLKVHRVCEWAIHVCEWARAASA